MVSSSVQADSMDPEMPASWVDEVLKNAVTRSPHISSYVNRVGSSYVNCVGSSYVNRVGSSYVNRVGSSYVNRVGSSYVNRVGSSYVNRVGSSSNASTDIPRLLKLYL